MLNLNKLKLNHGDLVLVDLKYKAQVVWSGRIFVRVCAGLEEWDIMKNRLTLYDKTQPNSN